MNDIYHTIESAAQGIFKDKGSRFLAFAYPASDEQQIKPLVAKLQKEFHDARHHCYAYRVGKNGAAYRTYDDGEPSGTAGKPILGQLLSVDVTDVLVVVVRYFGGTLLGTSGLINAYKNATKSALDNARRVERFWTSELQIAFDAQLTNKVMRIVKEKDLQITTQEFDRQYRLRLKVREGIRAEVQQQFEQLSVQIISSTN